MEQARDTDSAAVMSTGQQLVDSLQDGGDWDSLVKEYSQDSVSIANLGEMGWFAVRELPAEFREPIEASAVGEVTRPFWAEDGLQIIRVMERRDARPFSLEDDWDILKEYARRQKSATVVAEIVAEMKNKVHLEVRGI
jgi:foldase protein PrsA